MKLPSRCKKPTPLCGPSNYPISRKAVWVREGELSYIGVDLSPSYRVFTKAIFTSKGSYGYGETGSVFLESAQKPNSPVRAVKPPRLKLDGIGSTREASVNLGGPTTMVPSLHQRNIYIKRKLRVWTDWKCVSLVSAKTPLTCAGRQNTPSQGRRYRADKGNLRIMRWTYRYGTVFAPRQYLYQKVPTGMERPEMCFPSRCKNPTHLCGPSKYPV